MPRSLIVATQYDAFSIIERLFDYLAGSAQIVVHSPYPQASIARVCIGKKVANHP
jgi:hypothetical protein